ncbi:Mad3/BUB1 hoMad3/BUB1 homology region 1 [Fragilaria crotonensis]|nr:Mad3/BUB1 hoMad3/BUB1 homology region 1 [Fragilaria crotonensis]
MASATDDTPAWEMSKENAAPLARGRNVEIFEKNLLKGKSKEERDEAERMMQRFERRIALDDTDDPLVDWLSFIKFHQENYPSDTHAQFLLMERCARKLLHVDRYKADVRFIRLCVLYADKTDHPGDVFKFLHQHKVGTKVALFWTAWAWIAEQKADYSFAEKLFVKGINKEAQPLKLLEQRHKSFQARMSRHWLNQSEQDELEEEEESGRAALGGLSKKQILRNDRQARVPSNRRPQDTNTQATFIDRSQVRRATTTDKCNNVPSSGVFPIFVDENEGLDDEGYNLNDSFVEPHQQDLECEAVLKKENIGKAERWNERGGYASRFVQPSASDSIGPKLALSFDIHLDEDCAAKQQDEITKTKLQFEKGGRTLQKREREDMAEKLARDPTRYMKNPEKLTKDTKESLR